MDDPLQNVCFVFVLKMATTVGQRLNMGKRKQIFLRYWILHWIQM